MTAVLERSTFTTSRLMEFFSEKELSMQIGHARTDWKGAILKELVDNALDACEAANIPPCIEVVISDGSMRITDNGPGLPEAVLARSLDYSVRVSDKSYYVSPTRGQLGNALKCVWAAPFVLDGENGQVEVEAHGTCHRIEVSLNRIEQRPVLDHSRQPSTVKNGARVTVHWPEEASSEDEDEDDVFYRSQDPRPARQLLAGYATFNPHGEFMLVNLGGESAVFPARRTGWSKWLPGSPTCPHWYDMERLCSLVGAYIGAECEDGKILTVRDFLAQFAGLTGTQKRKVVLDKTGLALRTCLHDLVIDNDVDVEAVQNLLGAMKAETRPVKPQTLGVLGKEHLADCLTDLYGADPESTRYKAALGMTADGLPFVLEVAFGVHDEENGEGRQIITGLNWTPTLSTPTYVLATELGQARVDHCDPVTILFHLACPRLDFTDRGKSQLNLPQEIKVELQRCMQSVTRGWTQAKRRADRQGRLAQRELEEQRKANRRKVLSIKEAAYQVMRQAYLKASADGRLPANARQIMYAARPLVLELTEDKCWKSSAYFTQILLPNYIKSHPKETASWDVVFDARGHITEPHTGRRIELGTIQVRGYTSSWHGEIDEVVSPPEVDKDILTKGPANRFRYALFVEKEGFDSLLRSADIANRFDLAVMSTKGMSVMAARKLVDDLSGRGVTVLVLRDFDKSGFSIVHTLATSGRRYRFKKKPHVIDLGLRLEDVRVMDLASEPVEYRGEKDPWRRLKECGATQEECSFLAQPEQRCQHTGWTGKRVELNALTSEQFIDFLERKLVEIGVKKLVPDAQILETVFRRLWKVAAMQEAIDQAVQEMKEVEIPEPASDLADKVAALIEGKAIPWETAVAAIVQKARVSE